MLNLIVLKKRPLNRGRFKNVKTYSLCMLDTPPVIAMREMT